MNWGGKKDFQVFFLNLLKKDNLSFYRRKVTNNFQQL